MSKTISNELASFLEQLQMDEDLEWEMKLAQGGVPRSVWETVSAFANTSGGRIVFGIEQNDNGFEVAGIAHPSRILDEFLSTSRNTSKISYSPCGPQDTQIMEVENKKIIIIKIPEVPRQYRPVYIGNNPYEGTFIRRHSGDYKCTKDEVDRMIREASENATDSTVLPEFNLDDIDMDSLLNFRRRFQTLHPTDPQNGYDDKMFLRSLGAYGLIRTTEVEGLTVAGLLMFGKELSIREWRTRHMIDYRFIKDDSNSISRWDDRITWEGNLFQGFFVIYNRLIDGMTTSFQLQGVTRVDNGPMQVTLREAFVNLLVHADYNERESSIIIRTPSSIIFRNPGSSRVSLRDLIKGDRSDPRNPALVRMFRRIGLAEEAGTGIPRIIHAWRELGLQMPDIESQTERYEFTLHLRQAHMLPIEERRWLKQIGDNWNETEQIALVHARHHGVIDNPILTKLTGKHPADVSRVLVSLRNKNYLEMVSGGRSPQYMLGIQANTKVASSINTNKQHDHLEEITEEIWAKLLDIATPIREHTRSNFDEIESVVISLCAIAPLSIKQISILIGRSPRYIRSKITGSLVAKGNLSYFYSTTPSRAGQKYITNSNNKIEEVKQNPPTNINPEQKEMDL